MPKPCCVTSRLMSGALISAFLPFMPMISTTQQKMTPSRIEPQALTKPLVRSLKPE